MFKNSQNIAKHIIDFKNLANLYTTELKKFQKHHNKV